ncbi:hypothetical protein [Jiangella alba]|uniref:hypothetical protein n=1 Tax=Jiangella alba TaxID=561176 RepID=UPI00083E9DC8|nr:hypothetical protein [Jiangella alba]
MAGARLRRRTVLAGAPALLVGCTSGEHDHPGQPAAATSPPSLAELDLTDWEVVRGQFALDPELAHFAAYVLASHPAPVRAAVERWRDALEADPAAAVEGRWNTTTRCGRPPRGTSGSTRPRSR